MREFLRRGGREQRGLDDLRRQVQRRRRELLDRNRLDGTMQQVKELQKAKSISEDDERRAEDEIQKLTDKAVKDVDAVVKSKEDELMAV